MNKIARVNICNKLSPHRFDKTAGIFNKLMSGLGRAKKVISNTASNYLKPLPKVKPPKSGFFGGAVNGLTAFYDPRNIVDAFRYGPGTFIKELKNTTFNLKKWKKHPFLNTIDTLNNVVAPYWAISAAIDDSPYMDTEGSVQRGLRHFMDVVDVADLSGKVMTRNLGKSFSSSLGFMPSLVFGRAFLPSIVGKKIDNWLGTGPTKEVLRQRFIDRLNKEVPKFLKSNPNMNPDEAQSTVVRNILSQYDPDSLQKLFS